MGQRIFSARSRACGPFQPLCPASNPLPTPRQPHARPMNLPHSPRSRPYHHKTSLLPQFHAFFRQSLPQPTSNSSQPAPVQKPQIKKTRPLCLNANHLRDTHSRNLPLKHISSISSRKDQKGAHGPPLWAHHRGNRLISLPQILSPLHRPSNLQNTD